MIINPAAAKAFLAQASDVNRPENKFWNNLEKQSARQTISLWDKRLEQFDTKHLQALEARIVGQTEKLEEIAQRLRKPRPDVSILAKLDTQVNRHNTTRRLMLRAFEDMHQIFAASDLQKCTGRNNTIDSNNEEIQRGGITRERAQEILADYARLNAQIDEETLNAIDPLIGKSNQKFHALINCAEQLDEQSTKLSEIGKLLNHHYAEVSTQRLVDPKNTDMATTEEHLKCSLDNLLENMDVLHTYHTETMGRFRQLDTAHDHMVNNPTDKTYESAPSLISQSQPQEPDLPN